MRPLLRFRLKPYPDLERTKNKPAFLCQRLRTARPVMCWSCDEFQKRVFHAFHEFKFNGSDERDELMS